jgi:Tfp pilus assembly protein PilZ
VSILKALKKYNQMHRRKQPRKPSFVPVDYAVGDRAFTDFIKNISAGGVFIEIRTPFSVGQEISMTFSSAKLDEPIKIRGKISWANNILGIGVKFMTENQALVAMLEAL